MATSKLSSPLGTIPSDNDSNGLGDRSLNERRASPRIPVEGSALVWRVGLAVPQPARIRDVSAEGAYLETAPLPLGQEVRIEIEGECSSFTLDAVVARSRFDPARGAIAVRFVDRDPRRYAKWLQNECIRLSMWTCNDSAPLVAEGSAEIPKYRDDPALVPVHAVYNLVDSRPGTSLADLLGVESFDPMHVRIAVARLLESRALTVKVAAKENAVPSSFRLIRRFRKP